MLKILQLVIIISAIIFIVALFTLIIIYSSQPSYKPSEQQTAAEAPNSKQNTEEHETFGQRVIRDPIALFTFLLVIANFLLAASAVIQLRFLAGTVDAAYKSADAANKTADVAKTANDLNQQMFASRERPWVKFINCELGGPIVGEDHSFQLIMRYKLKNVGTTPAKNVRVGFTVYPLKDGMINDRLEKEIMKIVCDNAKAELTFTQSGKMLFPNDILGPPYTTTFGIDVNNFIEKPMKQMGIESTNTFLLICYTMYNFTFDKTTHTTVTTYFPSRNDRQPIYPIEKKGVTFGNRLIDGIELNKLSISNAILGEYAD